MNARRRHIDTQTRCKSSPPLASKLSQFARLPLQLSLLVVWPWLLALFSDSSTQLPPNFTRHHLYHLSSKPSTPNNLPNNQILSHNVCKPPKVHRKPPPSPQFHEPIVLISHNNTAKSTLGIKSACGDQN